MAITNYTTVGLFFVASVISARLLGPEGRGELAAIQNWALFAVTIGTLGIPVAAAYYAGKRPADTPHIFISAEIMLALLAVPVAIVAYWAMPWLMPNQNADLIQDARMFLWLIPIQFTLHLPYYVILGLNRLSLWNVIRLQLPILWLLVFAIGYAQSTLTPTYAAQGYLVISVLNGVAWLIALLLVVRGAYFPRLLWFSTLFRYGLPSALGSAPRQLNLRGDQLLMAAFLPAEMLGLYVVAVAWSGLLQPMTSALAQTIFPSLAGQHDRKEQERLLRHTLRLTILVSLLAGSLMLVLTPLLIPMVYGQEFARSVPAAFVLVFGALIAGMNNVLEDAFRGLGIPKWPMIAELSGLISTAILLLLLLPRFQLMGAAIASLISYLVICAILIVFLRRWASEPIVSYFVPQTYDAHVLFGRLYTYFFQR